MRRGSVQVVRRFVWRHWPISVLVVTSLVAGGLQLLHQALAVKIILTFVTIGFGILPLVDSWNAYRSGLFRVELLLPLTIVTALLQRRYWIALAAVAVYYLTKIVVHAARRRASYAHQLSVALLPTTAAVLRGRKVLAAAVNDLHIGDKIMCEAGTIIPVDGTIVEGTTTCDESNLSGDSQPVAKTVGDTVLSGSRVSGDPVVIKVEHQAIDSYLQSTIRLLDKSVGEQTKLVHTGDRYSLYLTIATVLIAAAAWYLGRDAHRFLSVLVLATVVPVLWPSRIALQRALGTAARQGIVFRNGSALQKFAEAETIAFGFTGIITEGKPVLRNVTALKPYTKNEILGLAASLEQASDHPLARSIVAEAQAQGFNFIKAKHVQSLTGQGLKANLQGKEILVGNASLLIEHGIQLPVKVPAKQLVLYVASNGQLAGTISFEDATRASVQSSFASLRKRGVRQLQILTSSPQPTVETAVAGLGAVDVHADAPTADKLSVLAAATHHPVAFVGKAAADSSLLTSADVGVAIGEDGLQAAHGPGVTILHDDIAYVALARTLVQRSFNHAMQSLLIGSLLSLCLMLLALSGKFPLLLGLGVQLVINCAVVLYPLFRSHKA